MQREFFVCGKMYANLYICPSVQKCYYMCYMSMHKLLNIKHVMTLQIKNYNNVYK